MQLAILFIRQVGRYFYLSLPTSSGACAYQKPAERTASIRFAPAAKPPIGLRCRGLPESIDVVEARRQPVRVSHLGASLYNTHARARTHTHTFLVVVRARCGRSTVGVNG